MNDINKIFNCNSVEEIQSVIENYSQDIHDYFGQSYDQLEVNKILVNDYVLQNEFLPNLDLSKGQNLAYLSLLLSYAEKFGLTSPFQKLFNILKDKSTIGSRLEAASLFLLNIHTYDEYLSVYDAIINKLQISALFEEDKIESVVATFANYINKVLIDAGSRLQYIQELKKKIIESKNNKDLHFVNHPIIDKILELDCSTPKNASISIQSFRDSLFLAKIKKVSPYAIAFLIEKETKYTSLIKNAPANFDAIRDISNKLCSDLTARTSIHSSLGKGVSILETESQMLVYMQAYGNMHRAKLLSALRFLPNSMLSKQIEIIDWGCGQATASMVFYEYLLDKKISYNVDRITLVEPSEICLKRGALHTNKFYGESTIKTINKEINLLNEEDIRTNNSNIKFHLFSNIIDANVFSLSQLLKLLSTTQRGSNYFVCVSPYITDAANDRLDSFCNYFKRNYSTYQLLGEETFGKRNEYWDCNYHYNSNTIHKNHYECGGKRKWTKVVRVFHVDFP